MWVTWPVYFLLTVLKILWVVIVWWFQLEVAIFKFVFQGIYYLYLLAYAKSPIGTITAWISLGCEAVIFTLVSTVLSEKASAIVLNIYTFGTAELVYGGVLKLFENNGLFTLLPEGAVIAIIIVTVFALPIALAVFMLFFIAYPIIHGLIASLISAVVSLFTLKNKESDVIREYAENQIDEGDSE